MSMLIILVVILIILILLTTIVILFVKNNSKRDEFKIINTLPSSTNPIRQKIPVTVSYTPRNYPVRHRYYHKNYPRIRHRYYPTYFYNYPDYVYYDDCGYCCDDCIDGKCIWESTTGTLKKGTNQQCIKYKDCSDRKNGLNNKEKDIKCSKISLE